MISASTLCTFFSPRWALASFDRMHFAKEFTCFQFLHAAVLLTCRETAGDNLSGNVHLRFGRQGSFLISNFLRTLVKIDTLR